MKSKTAESIKLKTDLISSLNVATVVFCQAWKGPGGGLEQPIRMGCMGIFAELSLPGQVSVITTLHRGALHLLSGSKHQLHLSSVCRAHWGLCSNPPDFNAILRASLLTVT